MTQRPKPGLKRGLDALFAEHGTVAEASSVGHGGAERRSGADSRRRIPIDLIRPNAGQPRKRFDDEESEALASSVAEHGILQPLLLRPDPKGTGTYEIVAGERRWRAAQKSGLHEVPAIVRNLSDDEALTVALIENLQRSDLNPVEEARGYRELADKFQRSQSEIAKQVGRSRSHVANSLRLLKLPEPVLELLVKGQMDAGHARPLIGHPRAAELGRRIVKEGWSVRQAEALAAKTGSKDPAGGGRRREASDKSPDTAELEGSLSASIGTPVTILDRKGSGEVRIRYADYEQLDRIAERLSGTALD